MSGTDYGAIGVEPGDSSGFYLAGKVSYLNNALYNAQVRINRNSDVEVDIRPGLDVHGGLTVTGTKSRSVETEPYSKRLLYCYETSSPMFGDVGEGVIGSDGNCYVTIDPIFAETVNLSQYQVFLQKYGQGECYVSERKPSFFVVSGTEGLSFGWEIKAKQNDFDQLRLEMDLDTVSTENYRSYSTDAINHIQEIQHYMKIVTSFTVFNDAVGTRLSVSYSEIDDTTGQVISDNKRADRVITDASARETASDLKDYAQAFIDNLD